MSRKCSECPARRFTDDKVHRTKFITRATCKEDKTITVTLGDTYVGKTFRVVIEELPSE